MTDNPIGIPALIARISLDRHPILRAIYDATVLVEKLGPSTDQTEAVTAVGNLKDVAVELLDALEQAQAEIAREKSRADAAESSEIRMSTLVGKLSDALDHAVAVHIRAQEDGTRLREALRAVAPLLIPGITWTDETGQLVKRMVQEALAATKETT